MAKRKKIDHEAELFDAKTLKGKIVERMTEGYFKKLLKKGWNPGFFLEVKPTDYPTLAIRYVGGFGTQKIVTVDPTRSTEDAYDGQLQAVLQRRRCLVLSNGPEDQNRRIVAQNDDGWVVGLWIAVLQRQVKEGTLDVKSWCFSVLLDLENINSFFHVQADYWVRELLMKEQP